MSIDNCFSDDVKEAVGILESVFHDVKKYLRTQEPSRPYADAREFVKHYKLCVSMGRSTEDFREMLPRYLDGFGIAASGLSKHGFNAAVLVAAGGLAVYSYPERPLFILSSLIFGIGLINLVYSLSSSANTVRVRSELPRDNVLLDGAFEKIKDNRIAEARLYKG